MTILNKKSKIIVLLSLLFVVCIGFLLYLTSVTAVAADIVIGGEQLFPRDNVILDAEHGTFDIRTEQGKGLVLESTAYADSDETFSIFTYNYFKKIRPFGLNGTNLFEMEFEFDTFMKSVANSEVEIRLQIDENNYISWFFSRVSVAELKAGIESCEGGATRSVAGVKFSSLSVTIGVEITENKQRAYFKDGTKTTNHELEQATDGVPEIWPNAEATLSVLHKKYGSSVPEEKTLAILIKSFCGNSFVTASSKGIVDTATPSILVSAEAVLDGEVFGGVGTASDHIKLNYGGSGLNITVQDVYDIFAEKGVMIVSLSDRFLYDYNGDAVNKTYLWEREQFTDGQFLYSPKDLYGNILAVGMHRLTIGVQKQNGQIAEIDIFVDVVTSGVEIEEFEVKPEFDVPEALSGDIEYFEIAEISGVTVSDVLGRPVAFDVVVKDSSGNRVDAVRNLDKVTFTPRKLGKYTYEFVAKDSFGLTKEIKVEVNCVKTSSPTAKEDTVATKAGQVENTIFYKEDASKYLLSPAEAVTALFEDIDLATLVVDVRVETRDGGGTATTVASSHSFVPSKNETYYIIYTAKDIVYNVSKPTEHIASVEFELTVKNQAAAAVFDFGGVGHGVIDSAISYPDGLYPAGGIVLPDLGKFVIDFDSLNNANYFVGKLTTQMTFVGGSILGSEYNSNSRTFTPSREGVYKLTYTVTNSAGIDTSITFDIAASAYVPKFDLVAFTNFVSGTGEKIALKQYGELILELPQNVVTDGYKDNNVGDDYKVTFGYKILDGQGIDVTNLVDAEGKFTPASTGVHTVVYTATNIMGKATEATRLVQVYVPSPEIKNPSAFSFPDIVAYLTEYGISGGNKIAMMGAGDLVGLVEDHYGTQNLTISLEVRKQNAAGKMVAADASEWSLNDTEILFKPNQKGVYVFDFVLENIGGGTARVSYAVTAVAFGPEANQAEVAKFRQELKAPVYLYEDYTTDTLKKTAIIPAFDKTKLILDTEGDGHKNVHVTVSVKRPSGGALVAGEWNATSREFKPRVQGGYIFNYEVTNASGEVLSIDFVVQVYVFTPEIDFDTFKEENNLITEVEFSDANSKKIPFLTNKYVQDGYFDLDSSFKLNITLSVTRPDGTRIWLVPNAEGEATVTFALQGMFEFEFVVKNVGGKTATQTFKIKVIPIKPKIMFVGNETFWVSNATVVKGSSLQLPDVTAVNQYGNPLPSSEIIIEYKGPKGTGKQNVKATEKIEFIFMGEYTFTYYVKDENNNETTEIFRIRATDETAPDIKIFDDHNGKVFYVGVDDEIVLRKYGEGFNVTDGGVSSPDYVTVAAYRNGNQLNYNKNENFAIAINLENEGSYLIVYTAKDEAGNTTTKQISFSIIAAPQIVRPMLPDSMIGNSVLDLPVPLLDRQDPTFKTYCIVTSPSGKVLSSAAKAMTQPFTLTFEESSRSIEAGKIVMTPYRIKYYTEKIDGGKTIKSKDMTFEIMSLDGDPIFLEDTLKVFLTQLNKYRSGEMEGFAAGLVASKDLIYPFPEVKAMDVFNRNDVYAIKIRLTNGNDVSEFYPKNGVYSLIFKDESVYTIEFIVTYKPEAEDELVSYVEVIGKDGNVVKRVDVLRVSGDGNLKFQYNARDIDGFDDPELQHQYDENKIGKTLFVLPETGEGVDITFIYLTARGTLNGTAKDLPISIYIYGPDSAYDSEKINFMQMINLKKNSTARFTATKVGRYTIVYEVVDDLKNMKRIEYHLEVKDETPPKFENVEEFKNTFATKTGSAEAKKVLVLPTPNVSDNYDEIERIRIEITIVEPNGNRYSIDGFSFVPSMDGVHTAIYTIWDSSDKSTLQSFEFTVVPEVPPTTPILGIAVGGIVGLTVMAGLVYLIVFKNIFRIKKLIPKKA